MPWYFSIPIILVAAILTAAVVSLFIPVEVWIDSRSRDVKIRWAFLLFYKSPWPGALGTPELTIAGIPVHLETIRQRAVRKKKRRPQKSPAQKREQRQKAQQFLLNCLADGDVRGALQRQFTRLPVDLWETIEVNRWSCQISLPDPALNGMLWGALAAGNAGRNSGLRCNFSGHNEAWAEVKLHPQRAIRALLRFVLRMPYWSAFKQWRMS